MDSLATTCTKMAAWPPAGGSSHSETSGGDSEAIAGQAAASPLAPAERRRRQYRVIGLAFRSLDYGFHTNWYQNTVYEGVARAAYSARVNVVHFCEHLTADPETSAAVYADLCDGVLHIGHDLTPESQRAIQRTGIPLVGLGGPGPLPGLPYTDIDDREAVREATTRLIRLGHRRIAMLASPPSTVSDWRVEGYRLAHADAGIAVAGPVIDGSYSKASGAESAATVLALPREERPTGVVCFNDAVALGFISFAASRGIDIPREISVVGVDDIIEAKLARPGLTTIRQPLREIGEKAVELLLGILAETMAPDQPILLPHEFVVRDSIGPPPDAS